MSTSRSDKKEHIAHSERHKCDLPEKLDITPLTPSPFYNCWQKLCHRLRRTLTVHQGKESWQYFKSNAAFVREQHRHVGSPRYKYVIHPLSKFIRRKGYVVSCIWLYLLFDISFSGTFNVMYFMHTTSIPIIILDSVLVIDIVLRFFSGYIIDQTREIVLDHKRIVKHYLKTYFIVDALPIIVSNSVKFVEVSFPYLLTYYHITSIRFLRIKTVVKYFDRAMQLFRVPESFRSLVIIYFTAVVCIHFGSCLLKYINIMETELGISTNASWVYKLQIKQEVLGHPVAREIKSVAVTDLYTDYFSYMTIVMCHFFGAGYGLYLSNDPIEMMTLFVISVFGIIFHLYTLAYLLLNFVLTNISETKYEEVLLQTRNFMMTRKYPGRLKRRIEEYYHYKFDGKYFSETKILSSLSGHLRMEVLLYSCKNLVEQVNIFKGLSKAAVGCMIALLKQEIYLPNDEIMRADDDSGTLYFILFGTCAVCLMSGREAMHIEDGYHFGENTDFAQDARDNFMMYKVKAVEPCEIYCLSKKDIDYCCKMYPEIAFRLDAIATKRVRRYNNILARTNSLQSISATDIVAELRRKRIISRGRHRVGPLNPQDV